MPDPAMVEHAAASLAVRIPDYHRFREYYDGDQPLAFASDSFRSAFGSLFRAFAYNRCATTVDAIADRLQVSGWESGDNAALAETCDALWTRNQGDALQGTVHVEALRCGDSYVIVWPDADGIARMNAQRADLCSVVIDPETEVTQIAIKIWRVETGEDKGRWRLTVYEPDLITRWITTGKPDQRPRKLAGFVPYADEQGPAETPNPLGIVPVIHFANNALFPCDDGQSELRDVTPLQDGLNKSIADMMVAGEFLAYPQRWAVGIEPQVDPATGQEVETFRPGLDRLFMVADAQARFGEFSAIDMTQFTVMHDAWDAKISRVSRVPVHWLGMTGNFPSGESLKTAEAPFVSKIRDRQIGYGMRWSQVMRMALAFEGVGPEASDGVMPIWKPAEPRSDREYWELAQLKRAAGVPDRQIWIEAGYTEEQVMEFEQAASERREAAAASFGVAFNRGV